MPNEQLLHAAKKGDSKIISLLLTKDVDIDALNEAVSVAIDNRNVNCVHQLLEAGADPNFSNEHGVNLLMRAAFSCTLTDVEGFKATEMVRMLLDAGANINAYKGEGHTALMTAVWWGKDETMSLVRLMLEAGANVNVSNEDRRTALMDAVKWGHYDTACCVRLLLDAGADVNATDKEGITALMDAAARENTEVVRLLLDAGANVDAMSKEGKTALFRAARRAARTGYTDIIEMLLNAGANPNAFDKDGQTALMYVYDLKIRADKTASVLRKICAVDGWETIYQQLNKTA